MSSETARAQRKDTAPTEEAHRELARDYPLEEPQKNYHTILEQQMTQAEEELERPASALLLSGFAAGLDLSFGPLTMAVGLTLTKDVLSKPIQEIFVANLYAVALLKFGSVQRSVE